MTKVVCLQTPKEYWKYFYQPMKVQGVIDVRQREIHTAKPLEPEPSASEIYLVIEELKCHKSPGIDQIPVELFKAGV